MILSNIFLTEYATYISIAIIVVFFILNMFINKTINQTITLKNDEAISNIKNVLGSAKFETLLKDQDQFIEEFYKKQREELGLEDDVEILDTNLEDTPDDILEETVDAVVDTVGLDFKVSEEILEETPIIETNDEVTENE